MMKSAPPQLILDFVRTRSTTIECDTLAIRSCTILKSDWLDLARSSMGSRSSQSDSFLASTSPTASRIRSRRSVESDLRLVEQAEEGHSRLCCVWDRSIPNERPNHQASSRSRILKYPLRLGPKATLPQPTSRRIHIMNQIIRIWNHLLSLGAILGHELVGGFLTDYEWSSVIESSLRGSVDHAATTCGGSGADCEGVRREGRQVRYSEEGGRWRFLKGRCGRYDEEGSGGGGRAEV
ncbi:hypothetical protein LINPERPRIM_LOCUS7019 [Linum perenne]